MMETTLSVISTALPVFVALGIGIFCRSRDFITREGVDTLKKVIINLTLPFVLFSSFATATYSLSAAILPVVIFTACCAMLAAGYLWVKIGKSGSKTAPFIASGFESGMLGFSLFALLFPNKPLATFAMISLGQEIFVFTVYKMLLTGKSSPKAILNDILTSPTLIAVILGLVIGASGLYDVFCSWGISQVIESVTGFISAPTGTIILFAIGYDLVFKEVNWKKTGSLVAMRVVIAGLMVGTLILLNRTLLGGMIFEGALVILFILPPPYIIPIFSKEESEQVHISSALSVLTFVTMLLFALCSVLYA